MLMLEKLQDDVQHLTRMVIDGELPGVFVVGAGGLGKTHAVMKAFQEAGLTPPLFNTHASPYALYREFHRCRDERVVLMEDLEALYTSTPALSILRSALWGPKNPDGTMTRTVTWTSSTLAARVSRGSSRSSPASCTTPTVASSSVRIPA